MITCLCNYECSPVMSRKTKNDSRGAANLDAGATHAAQTWASGYLNSFQSWSYAKNAFDKWSALTAQRLAALRGVGSPKP